MTDKKPQRQYKKKKRVNHVIYVRLTAATHQKLVALANKIMEGNQSGTARYLIEKGIEDMLNESEKQVVSDDKENEPEQIKTLDN